MVYVVDVEVEWVGDVGGRFGVWDPVQAIWNHKEKLPGMISTGLAFILYPILNQSSDNFSSSNIIFKFIILLLIHSILNQLANRFKLSIHIPSELLSQQLTQFI